MALTVSCTNEDCDQKGIPKGVPPAMTEGAQDEQIVCGKCGEYCVPSET
jgi:hypothetical protein